MITEKQYAEILDAYDQAKRELMVKFADILDGIGDEKEKCGMCEHFRERKYAACKISDKSDDVCAHYMRHKNKRSESDAAKK